MSEDVLDSGHSKFLEEGLSEASNLKRFGWYYQQLLKIGALRNMGADRLIIWDADCVSLRPLRFFLTLVTRFTRGPASITRNISAPLNDSSALRKSATLASLRLGSLPCHVGFTNLSKIWRLVTREWNGSRRSLRLRTCRNKAGSVNSKRWEPGFPTRLVEVGPPRVSPGRDEGTANLGLQVLFLWQTFWELDTEKNWMLSRSKSGTRREVWAAAGFSDSGIG